jgi:hypothetical protein
LPCSTSEICLIRANSRCDSRSIGQSGLDALSEALA